MKNEERRNEWIEKQLKSIPDGLRILDAGAGELRWKKFCSHLEYVSQDFYQYHGGDGEGLQVETWNTFGINIISDIIDIPVEDNTFDIILCSEVLEHIPNPEMAIKEFSRILKPGGMLILTAPFCSLTHMAPYYFCTGFSKYWYETKLKQYDFEISEIVENGNFFSYMQQELNRFPYVFKTYYSKTNFFVIALGKILSLLLKRYENIKNESSELLCFGLFLRAIKK